jgi:beta-aspartyl-peptidase (threonine type)
MSKIAIVVHGGAGEDSEFIRQNQTAYKEGLQAALHCGHEVLKNGGSAIDAVERAVQCFEDNPLFNAGRGSSLNSLGEIEMDASIMNGENLSAGAVCMVKNIKNPISLARKVLEETNHVLIGGHAAMQLAADLHLPLETDSYFMTDHQQEVFMEVNARESRQEMLRKKIHGTVGAVAADLYGNVAAATSTGGTENSLPGRIGDSCIIGCGCYANNDTCAVSATGDGEFIITGVVAHSLSVKVANNSASLQEACNEVIKAKTASVGGNIGLISVTKHGGVGMSFNSERMHRAWIDGDGATGCEIY